MQQATRAVVVWRRTRQAVIGTILAGALQLVAAAAPSSAVGTNVDPGGTIGALAGWEDAQGWHVDVLGASDTASRELAVLQPANADEGPWTGEQCLSGEGRYAAVIVGSAGAANTTHGRAGGATAYSIDLVTGRVRTLGSGYSLMYYNPGCGSGSSATFSHRFLTTPDKTGVTTYDLGSGAVIEHESVGGQITSAVPSGVGVLGVHGGDIVELVNGSARTVVRGAGAAYDVHPSADGGFDFLTATSSHATAWHWRDGRTKKMGTRRPAQARLFQGDRNGNVLSGADTPLSSDLRPSPALAQPASSVSLDGSIAVTTVGRGAADFAVVDARTGTRRTVDAADLSGGTVVAPRSAVVAGAGPPCAVPRNDPYNQTMQPNARQITWAIGKAVAGALTSPRPGNYLNTGLAAYAPSTDFPRILLQHSVGQTDSVPPLVYQAVAAQESNYSQASYHALPGISGNPLIADYYGSYDVVSNSIGIGTIDYTQADCGYGVGQVTTGMRSGDPDYGPDKQRKIALDYQENIAAGLQILEKEWNSLHELGIIANNGDPAKLENWYFALWAYNTGIHPQGPDGTSGLGWLNNPANPDYPPNRAPYLKLTGADAEHPADWPYQERVLGWMSRAIVRFGTSAYPSAVYHGGAAWVQVAPADVACSGANFCTAPAGGAAGSCGLADFECWWSQPATWIAGCASTCATSPGPASGTEPALRDPHPPTCSVDTSLIPVDAVIVDDLSVPTNIVGCGSSNWRSRGTFSISYGSDAAGQPVGEIDTHQLGAGLGGHVLFTHLESASSASLINIGTWAPPLTTTPHYYDIKVHLPATGADAASVTYTIRPRPGAIPYRRTVSQNHGESWLDLGTYPMAIGGTLSLTNAANNATGIGTSDVAFDAAAFIPQGGYAQIPMTNTSTCKTVLFIGARGSGEKGPGTPGWVAEAHDRLGLGKRVGPMEAEVATHLSDMLPLSVIYPADSIGYGLKHPLTYIRDINSGTAYVVDRLRAISNYCPSQRIVMAGYSSGAMVIHRAMATLAYGTTSDQGIAHRIVGVDFYADGDRRPLDPVVDFGTAATRSLGVAVHGLGVSQTPIRPLPDYLGRRSLSICDWRDIVCDFRSEYVTNPVGNALEITYAAKVHSDHYMGIREKAHFAHWLWSRAQ